MHQILINLILILIKKLFGWERSNCIVCIMYIICVIWLFFLHLIQIVHACVWSCIMMCFPLLIYVDSVAADGWGRYLPFPLWVVDGHLLICNTSTTTHCLTNLHSPWLYLLLILLLLFLQTFWRALLGSNFLTGKRASLMHQVSSVFCLLHGYSTYMYHIIPSHFLPRPQALSCFSTGCQGWCSYSTLP